MSSRSVFCPDLKMEENAKELSKRLKEAMCLNLIKKFSLPPLQTSLAFVIR